MYVIYRHIGSGTVEMFILKIGRVRMLTAVSCHLARCCILWAEGRITRTRDPWCTWSRAGGRVDMPVISQSAQRIPFLRPTLVLLPGG